MSKLKSWALNCNRFQRLRGFCQSHEEERLASSRWWVRLRTQTRSWKTKQNKEEGRWRRRRRRRIEESAHQRRSTSTLADESYETLGFVGWRRRGKSNAMDDHRSGPVAELKCQSTSSKIETSHPLYREKKICGRVHPEENAIVVVNASENRVRFCLVWFCLFVFFANDGTVTRLLNWPCQTKTKRCETLSVRCTFCFHSVSSLVFFTVITCRVAINQFSHSFLRL